jgi:hypothetical protein
MSADKSTLTLLWTQTNFIEPGEDVIVGDFDGNGADDLLLYNASAGTFRMATRTTGSSSAATTFSLVPEFSPGDLRSGELVSYQLRAGQWGAVPSFPGADGLIAYDGSSGQVALYNLSTGNRAHPGLRSFATVFTWNTNPPAPGVETLSTGRIGSGPTDSLVLRNTSTGTYRFLDPVPQRPQLTPTPGVVPGQLPVVAADRPMVFARLNFAVNGVARNDNLFFNAIQQQFVSTAAALGSTPASYGYQPSFSADTSTRNQGWAAVEHDVWLFLRCQFADYPNLEDPLFTPDTYIQNEFGRNGIGLGGFVDYFREISYGKIDYNINLIPGWYPTIPTTQYINGGARFLASSTCAENYGHGITATSFSAPNYVGPAYAGIITLWNKQHDAGNDGGNLTVLDSGIVGTDMSGAAHEALHAYGLAHPHSDQDVSFCGGASTEYCDIWDPMGASQVFTPKLSTYNLPANNPGMSASVLPTSVLDGIELNAPNRLQLNAIPANRILTLVPQAGNLGNQQATVTLAALEKPEANGFLVLVIRHCDASGSPVCGDPDHFFTVELRVQFGWDVNIPQPTVLIHEVWGVGRAYTPGSPPVSYWTEYLKTRTVGSGTGPGQAFLPGEFLPGTSATYSTSSTLYPDPVTTPPTQVADPSSPLSITIQSFDAAASTASVLVTY